MTTENKHLWTRNTERFVVEVLVGTVWVEHSSYDVLSAAQVGMEKALVTAGVLSAKLTSLASRVICTQIGDEVKPAAVLIPHNGYEDTGTRVPCRACRAPDQRVMTGAGNVPWVFCTACGKVYPHAVRW